MRCTGCGVAIFSMRLGLCTDCAAFEEASGWIMGQKDDAVPYDPHYVAALDELTKLRQTMRVGDISAYTRTLGLIARIFGVEVGTLMADLHTWSGEKRDA